MIFALQLGARVFLEHGFGHLASLNLAGCGLGDLLDDPDLHVALVGYFMGR